MVILVSAKQLPVTGVAVKVYSVVMVLFMAGDQVPLKPLFETVGKVIKTSPTQMVATCVNVGVIMGITTMFIVVVLAHCPASGVNV